MGEELVTFPNFEAQIIICSPQVCFVYKQDPLSWTDLTIHY